jgi:hypothetical protein
MSTTKRVRWLGLLVAAMVLFATGSASAAEWTLMPSLDSPEPYASGTGTTTYVHYKNITGPTGSIS